MSGWFISEGFARWATSKVHVHDEKNNYVCACATEEIAKKIVGMSRRIADLEHQLAEAKEHLTRLTAKNWPWHDADKNNAEAWLSKTKETNDD